MRVTDWRDSWVGRTIRRLGRIGIASMAAICGLAVFGFVLTVLGDAARFVTAPCVERTLTHHVFRGP